MYVIKYRGKDYDVRTWNELANVAFETEKIDIMPEVQTTEATFPEAVVQLQQMLNDIVAAETPTRIHVGGCMKKLELNEDQLITIVCALSASIRESKALLEADNNARPQMSYILQRQMEREQEVLAFIQQSRRI